MSDDQEALGYEEKYHSTLTRLEAAREQALGMEKQADRFCAAVNDIARALGMEGKDHFAPEAVLRKAVQVKERHDLLYQQHLELFRESDGELTRKFREAEEALRVEMNSSAKTQRVMREAVVIRALHSGCCLGCGYMGPASDFVMQSRSNVDPWPVLSYYVCPKCSLTVSFSRAGKIMREFAGYMGDTIAGLQEEDVA